MPDGLVRFSSSVLVNDAVEVTVRFTAFSLDPANRQVLQTLQNRLTTRKASALSFQGGNLLTTVASLENIEALHVAGGQPRVNAGGYREAASLTGELVTLSLALADGTELSASGIITDLTVNFGPGRASQTVDFVFHPCDRLRLTDGSDTYYTRPDA